MAACLITVNGTYGEILFNYIDAGLESRFIVSGPGEFYLDDDGSNYTYSILYGDVTASSICITLTESLFDCYLIRWADTTNLTLLEKFIIQSIVVNEVEYSLYEKLYKYNNQLLYDIDTIGNAINELGYPNITCPSVKSPYNLIIRTFGGHIPYLKLSDKTTSYNIYLKGTPVVDCVPAGYTEMNIWPVIPVTTTSTTTTTTTTFLP